MGLIVSRVYLDMLFRFLVVIVWFGAMSACSVDSSQSSAGVRELRTPAEARTLRDSRCIGNDPRNPCEIYSLSLVELIARPEIYDGHRVLVRGFVTLEHEDNGLYLSSEDAAIPIRKNGLWLDLPSRAAEGSQLFLWNRRYVLVEGTFSALNSGHMDLWSGAILDISRYRAISGGEGRADERRTPSSK